MIRERQPDDDESTEDPPGPDRSALLDEYWKALNCGLAAVLRQELIDRAAPGESIATDLDVLDELHRCLCMTLADGETSPQATTRLAKSLAIEACSRPDGTGAENTLTEKEGGAVGDYPQRIGKYLVVEMLDTGGQAEVFRVMHPELGNECVLKLSRRLIATEDEVGRDALKREGRLLVQCEHPNLVRVFDMDVHEGRRFVVMEYVKGLTLQQYVARHRPNPRRGARLVIELAGAVAYLHDQGITHQDIKPQNVLIDTKNRPRLIDFGLARQNHAWCDDANDWVGGTAGYMSPEQALGRADQVGPRTDVFGLGGLLYHLLTGRALYVGSSAASVRRLAREGAPVPISKLTRGVPRSFERICHKAVARYPEQRYGTALEVGRELRRSLRRRWVATGALAALVSFTAVALFVLRPGPQATARERAMGPELAPAQPGLSPLKIVQFVGKPYRPRPGLEDSELPQIGHSDQPIREGDNVRLTGKLNSAAYCYVIALTPDRQAQLYWPSKDSDLPGLSPEIGIDEWGFDLADGPGLQAFVVIASRQKLPPIKEWKGWTGLLPHWTPVVADDGYEDVWEYADGEYREISSTERGPLQKRPRSRRAPFKEVCEYLEHVPGIEAIRAIAFPVKRKK
jgi:tRNA A-37 threonylcarbamoyl transferase component Bud32